MWEPRRQARPISAEDAAKPEACQAGGRGVKLWTLVRTQSGTNEARTPWPMVGSFLWRVLVTGRCYEAEPAGGN